MKLHKELELQRAVHSLLSDPSIIRETVSGQRLQIFSPGRLNVYGGPDFRDMAILLNGEIIIGDGEFHKSSNLWFEHGHNDDSNYDNVILHIVLEDNISENIPFETVILDEMALNSEIAKLKVQTKEDIDTIQDLQDYSLIRILRKTAEAKRVLKYTTVKEALKLIVSNFVERYYKKMKRPSHTVEDLKAMILKLENSLILKFLNDVKIGNEINAGKALRELVDIQIHNEGKGLRQEIVMNCVLPLALAIADEVNRISLFVWYWSTPAINQYGILRRRFPNIAPVSYTHLTLPTIYSV